MAGPEIRDRQWTEDLLAGSVRLRCAYRRQGKRVLRFTVQLEVLQKGKWHAVVRYDNAHGFCRRDTIHADGTQEKDRHFCWERKRDVYVRDRRFESTLVGTPCPVHPGDQQVIDPHDYAQKVMELTAEFGKYVIDHPEVDEALPPESHIYFEIAGEAEFNRYSRRLAEQQLRDDGRWYVSRSRDSNLHNIRDSSIL